MRCDCRRSLARLASKKPSHRTESDEQSWIERSSLCHLGLDYLIFSMCTSADKGPNLVGGLDQFVQPVS